MKNEIFKNYLRDNRNAWEMQADGSYKALTNGSYSAQEKLIELSVNDIAPHIPQNQGNGTWQSVGVTLHRKFP